jgi:hypothetical protein
VVVVEGGGRKAKNVWNRRGRPGTEAGEGQQRQYGSPEQAPQLQKYIPI